MNNKRAKFGSRFGVIAAVGGSVVGLGNIWRFPYLCGENGGAAFLIVYIAISFMIAIPIMLSEFAIGRSSRSNPMHAYSSLSKKRSWGLAGLLGIATSIVILSFYSVIAGWALEFLRESIADNFGGSSPEAIKSNLNTFINSGWRPLVWTLVFVIATGAVVLGGVEKGIERINKILMPLLFLILIGLVINSTTLSGFSDGVSFLFSPDFSKINGTVILKALGQAFFSLSLGMGSMIIYGSYIKRQERTMKLAATVSVTDVTVAVLSGLAIFPAVFSFGINPTSGPELIFLTLPNVFQQIPGGYFVSIIFFFLVFIAAITSSVSMMEVLTSYISEEMKIKRWVSTLMSVSLIFILGSLCALSQMDNSPLTIGGKSLFDVFDNFSATIMLPLGGLLSVIFCGWVMDKMVYKNELTNHGSYGLKLYPVIRFIVKFIAPVVISLLFMSLLGFI